MDKYVLTSSKIPMICAWLMQFIVWFPISLYAFLTKDAVEFFSICSVFLFFTLSLVIIYTPSTQLIASKEGLFFSKKRQMIFWFNIQNIRVWTVPRDYFMTTAIIITPKNSKDDEMVFNLYWLKENTKNIDRILKEFLVQSRKNSEKNK